MPVNNIKIENPYLFFLLIPLVAIVIAGFFLIPKYKRFRVKNLISLGLHLVRSVRLTLAFVNIQTIQTSSDTELIVLADCSKSEFLNSEHRDGLIQDVYKEAGKAGGTKIGVVAFGKNQEVVTRLGSNYRSKSILKYFDDDKKGSFDNTATDLKAALLYADTLYSKTSAVRRRIIRSDGLETDGSAIEALDQLTADSVQIDAISRSQPEFDEVAITGLDYTDHAFVGKKQSLKVSVKSKKAGKLTRTLTRDGQVIDDSKKDVPVSKGLNVYEYTLESNTAGTFRYEVSISGRSDTFEENNKRSFTQDFADHYSVLFIGDSQDSLANRQERGIYTDSNKVKLDTYIATSTVPYTIQDFVKYDEIVLSNINVESLDHPEEFVANLKRAVEDYGKSLFTLGAVYAAAGKGDYRSDYNALLPIQNESDDGKAIVLLIDNSASRDTDNRLKKAKDGAKAIRDNLTEKDYISIITFSDSTKIVQPLTSVKNKEAVKTAINKIKTDGGTVRSGGLKASRQQLLNSDIENKFVITLSDGDPFDNESTLVKLVRQRAADNITCSFINISNSSGTSLLKKLATAGQGTYYYVRTAASLVNVRLTSVLEDVTEKQIDGEATAVSVQTANDPALSDVGTLPDIYGYNFARIKKAATTVLTVRYSHEQAGEDGNTTMAAATVPLYAYWEVGKAKGIVSSFTSDIGNSWTDDFRNSNDGKKFFQQRFDQSLPNRNSDSLLDRSYVNHGETSTVSFLAFEKKDNASRHIKVTSPENDETKEYDLAYDGKYFTGEVETGIIGLYSVEVTYSYDQVKSDGTTEKVVNNPEIKQLNFDYSSEFDRFPNTASTLLYALTKNSGQVTYDAVDYKVSDSELAFKHYQSLNVVFRIIVVVLLLIDIFIRKSEFKKKKKDKDLNLRAGK